MRKNSIKIMWIQKNNSKEFEASGNGKNLNNCDNLLLSQSSEALLMCQ